MEDRHDFLTAHIKTVVNTRASDLGYIKNSLVDEIKEVMVMMDPSVGHGVNRVVDCSEHTFDIFHDTYKLRKVSYEPQRDDAPKVEISNFRNYYRGSVSELPIESLLYILSILREVYKEAKS